MPREVPPGRQHHVELSQAYPRLLFAAGRSCLESAGELETARRSGSKDARPSQNEATGSRSW